MLPSRMRYGMSIDFYDSISHNQLLCALSCTELILVSKFEYGIYLQSKSITVSTTVSKSHTIYSAVFRKLAQVSYLADYVHFEGSIPYKPHRMLSFHAHICIKDKLESDWSSSVDVVKTDYDAGDMILTIKSKQLSNVEMSHKDANMIHYELGTYIERGRGLLQHTTFVTFVPKRVFISQLSFSILLRQIHDLYLIADSDKTELQAGDHLNYHFMNKQKAPLLQVKKAETTATADADADWYGELDICHLGVSYVKLRTWNYRTNTPSAIIIKVETELIGASFVSTFTEQSSIWPPYRIYNNTSMNVRFKQVVDESKEGDEMSAVRRQIPFDLLSPKQAAAFTWDLPQTGSKMLQLDVEQNNNYTSKVINLYTLYNNNQSEQMVIKKFIPNIGNPLAEGFLYMHGDSTEGYRKAYCILRPDVLYMYEDESRNILINIINLSVNIDNTIKYATIGRNSDIKNKLFSTFSSSMGFINNMIYSSQKMNNMNNDINHIRILMLTLANYMQLFSHLTIAILNKTYQRCESNDSKDGSKSPIIDKIRADRTSASQELLINQVSFLSNVVNTSLTENTRSGSKDESKDSLASSPTPSSVAENMLNVSSTSLHSFLIHGISVGQLLDELSNAPIQLHDLIKALIDCNIVESEEQAYVLCESWIAEGYLVKKMQHQEVSRGSMHSDNMDIIETGSDDAQKLKTEEEGDVDVIANEEDAVDEAAEAINMSPGHTSYRKEVTKLLSEAIKRRYLAAVSRQTPSVGSTSKILDEYLNQDLLLSPPSLCPELSAAMEQSISPDRNRNNIPSTSALNQEEQFGFTIIIGGVKYHFRCSSEMEYLGWLQACRQSVEIAWKEIALGRKTVSMLSIEDFQVALTIKARADGSTKVLEITEGDGTKKAPEIRGKKSGYLQSSGASLLMPLLNRGKRLLRQAGSTEIGDDWSADLIDKDQELIAVSFAVKAVSLSLIDSAPAEILYIGFNDITMTVVRYFDAVRFSVTVRNIQLSNQLLNPTFPVVLFARRSRQGPAGKLMLPGLDSDRYSSTSYPTLHLYLQQRYHNINPETGLPNHDIGQKLWYFDIFTLWLAPLQLAVDEEILVRLMRYVWSIRAAVMSGGNARNKLMKDDSIGLTSRRFLQAEINPREVQSYFMKLLDSARLTYEAHRYKPKKALNLYFSLMQLHPVDVTLNFRPSSEVQVSNAELAIVSIISQLDATRLCLNALFAENAFGSTTIISEIVVKHYRAAFWRHFHRLLGAADIVEGSVGLVTNLGTGFYDLFYEPIDGLLDENSSFLNGLSKGGMSLAARAIGGTSAFTSTITGGIGKGVSLLTLDSEFQRARYLRRFNRTSSVSEGLMVGTQELGKNIVEGFTGIVVSSKLSHRLLWTWFISASDCIGGSI
jgi:hypothetical protein